MDKAMAEAFGCCSPIALAGLLLVLLIILNWLIMPHFHSNFRYALLHVFLFFCHVMQIIVWSDQSKKNTQKISCIDMKVGDDDDRPYKEVQGNSTSARVPIHENIVDENEQLCIGELGQIMEEVGTLCDDADLFEEEPSMEEVEEAFHVYDENKDGFIDAGEINKVLCALGFVGASEVECRRMIKPYDHDGDGRIDFKEFVQLMEKSFC